MAEQPKSIDAAIAALVARIVDEFARTLASDDSIERLVSQVGLVGEGAQSAIDSLRSKAASIADLQKLVTEVVAILQAGSADLGRLIAPAAEAWSTVTGLIDSLASTPLPALPDPPDFPALPPLSTVGDLLQLALAQSIESVVRDLNASAWALFRSIGLIGPDIAPFDAVAGIIASPLGWVWERYGALRRTLDITIAGILTGQRATTVRTVPIGQADVVPAEVTALVPTAQVVLQRIVLNVAADTYDDPHPLTLEFLGTTASPPAFAAAVLRTPGLDGKRIALGAVAGLTVSGLEVVGLVISPRGGLQSLSGAPVVTVDATLPGAIALGAPGSLRIELAEPVFEVGLDGTAKTWRAKVGYARFEAHVPSNIAGPVLALVLPSAGITLRGSFVVVGDSQGFHLEGGVGFSVTFPDVMRLPGAVMRDLTTAVDLKGGAPDAADLALSAAGTVSTTLGPLSVTVVGLGLSLPISIRPDGDGNLGLIDIPLPRLATPTGIGISVDTPLIAGGGYLKLTDDGAEGALELMLHLGSVQLTVRAFGVFGTIDGALSFIIVISVEFTPAIELFLGLTLNGVGGIFGLNRSMDKDALVALAQSGRMNDIMFPDDLIARAPEVIAAVKSVFPARRDQFVVGPVLKLGWGRPVSFVTITVGVVFTFPDPVVFAIIGSMRVALPAPDAPVIDINADFVGIIDLTTGDLYFMASLVRSRIGFFDVSGDIGLQAGSSGFILTAGGFHPLYDGPRLPVEVRRLSISLSPSPLLSIRAEAYFAVTASTLQFGGGLYVSAKLGPIGARGQLTADVLIRTEPRFAFIAQVTGDFALTFAGEDILTAHLDVLLEGPGRWHARAHASISLFLFEVSGTLELEWGDAEAPLTAGPPVNVAAAMRRALDEKAWAITAPGQGSGSVVLRQGAAGLHPLGSVRITQTVAPLDLKMERFGTNPVEGANPVSLTLATSLTSRVANEQFAPGQFLTLSDQERLSQPAFSPMPAGVVIEDLAWRVADAVTVEVVYEEDLGEEPRKGKGLLLTLDEAVFQWSFAGATGLHAAQSAVVSPAPIGVNEVAYVVAPSAKGPVAAAFGSAASVVPVRATRDAGITVFADYEAELMGR